MSWVRIIVSGGGQTGADYGALVAAEECGLKTDGYVPRECRTEKGSNYELKRRFGLRELTTRSYAERTRKNVDMADAVLAFYFHDSPGTGRTIGYARSGDWEKGVEAACQ